MIVKDRIKKEKEKVMSVDYQATAVIGVVLPEVAFYQEIQIAGCEHNPIEGNFCSQCGRPRNIPVSKPIPEYDVDNNVLVKRGASSEIVRQASVARISNSSGDFLAVGNIVRGNMEINGFSLIPYHGPSIEDAWHIKKLLKEILEPLGLWDEEKFGIHALLHVY
ncbi:MAG: hypothetical protein Q7K65_01785 [Candidatus Buchananbacteria bacterium]|nr:hypothetical protein [Candidatus Buchananbacteria bacterium]